MRLGSKELERSLSGDFNPNYNLCGSNLFCCETLLMPRMPKQKPGRSKQDYQTPKDFLSAVKNRLRIEDFECDLAASHNNAVCPCYLTEEDDSLSQDISWKTSGWSWLNPPFANIAPWVKKAQEEAKGGAQVVMLVPASVGANWWATWVEPYAYQVYLNGRLTFVGGSTPYPKDCALLLYHPWGFTGHEIWYWKG